MTGNPGQPADTFRTTPYIVAMIALFAVLPPAHAQYLSDAYSARALGMGGAVRAVASDSSALDLNPALMGAFANYQVETDYRYFSPEVAHLVKLAFIDDITSRLATGVSYSWAWADAVPGEPRRGWVVAGESPDVLRSYRAQDYSLGFGLPIGRFGVGTTLVWHRFKFAQPEELEATPYVTRFTLNAGVLFHPTGFLNLALSGTNLVPTQRPDRPTTLGVGIAALAGKVASADLDVTVDLTGRRDLNGDEEITRDNVTVNVNLGGQVLAWKFLPIRAGFYTEQQTRSKFATAGLGLEAGQVRFSYALRYQVSGSEPVPVAERFYHAFTLGILFGPGN